ncbi:MAG TPA: hypothetical protein VG742_18180 [Dongiaceae bacterium]|nr:hypothetical protein [Dongiaceae bacterium]
MNVKQIQSVGLGGDGDEVDAIRNVEAVFRVKLDDSEAPNWFTAGDIYHSLRKVLPADEIEKPDLWDRFAAALAKETGVDPKAIRPESPLLSERGISASTVACVLIGIVVVVGLGLAFL